jgi:hypothetical protein
VAETIVNVSPIVSLVGSAVPFTPVKLVKTEYSPTDFIIVCELSLSIVGSVFCKNPVAVTLVTAVSVTVKVNS